MKHKKLKPVRVEWEDAGIVAFFKQNQEINPFYMTSIGFVLSHTKDRLILSTIVPKDREYHSVIVIPGGAIKKIRRLYEVRGPNNRIQDKTKGGRKSRKDSA